MISRYYVGDVPVCVVRGVTSTYVIEPFRHDLGISAAAMVARHLDELAVVAGPRHPDVETLLAARTRFRADEHVRAAS